MINYNGATLPNSDLESLSQNRGFKYGDAVFETLVSFGGRINFLESHYFRLMKSMRIMRMEIPNHFTLDYFESQLEETIFNEGLTSSPARIRVSVFRTQGGYYLPLSNQVEYLIECIPLAKEKYEILERPYQVDIFKEHLVSPSILSTIKTNNKAIHILGSIFSQENDLDNCLLINTEKNIVEALQANVFVVNGKCIKTPALKDGALDGIIRKQIFKMIDKNTDYEIKEDSISPFELQSADEIFITNVVMGVQPVSNFKKKIFTNKVAKDVLACINKELAF